jgi:hypothetical protein
VTLLLSANKRHGNLGKVLDPEKNKISFYFYLMSPYLSILHSYSHTQSCPKLLFILEYFCGCQKFRDFNLCFHEGIFLCVSVYRLS